MRDNMRFATIMICFTIGLVFAIMLQFLVTYEIILPDLIYNTITLRALQFISILGWTIVGVILSAIG